MSNIRNKNKILLVDDEYDITYTIKKVLEGNGFIVDSYTSSISALTNFTPGMYDLVVLDIKMPDMDGLELYEKIKEKDCKAKICFLTASEMFYEEIRKKYSNSKVALMLNKEYFIQKPSRTDDLVRQLNAIIDS
jgi:CheY-like chemotaxis protein